MDDRNTEQIAYWNGSGGQHWTHRQQAQDNLLAPISQALIERAAPRAGERAIDIGCGCGATTLELAACVGSEGYVLGVDISAPMLARARERAPHGTPVQFVEADATDYAFEAGRSDLIVSRFGVMFFAQPAISFANLRRGLRSGGRLAFVCWRDPLQNPWQMVPLQAAMEHVPRMPEQGPEAPGPFSFAREERVHRILAEAGFTSIGMEPLDFQLDLAAGRGLDAAVESALEIGPASRALEGQPVEVREAAAQSIRKALADALVGRTVPLGSAVWVVTARSF